MLQLLDDFFASYVTWVLLTNPEYSVDIEEEDA
jgi:hypothetical protein